MNAEKRYAHLKALLAEASSIDLGGRLEGRPTSQATLRWLGRLSALVDSSDDLTGAVSVKSSIDHLGTTLHERSVAQIMNTLYRHLAASELDQPGDARGAYIAVGNAFDATSALQDVFSTVRSTILIVDAYMDGRVVRDFLPLAPEGVEVALLTDGQSMKPDLIPVCRGWITQWGEKRPLKMRVTDPRVLHDRLVLGNLGDAWILTQSLKDFATRSPASIQKVDPELAAAKFDAYSRIWNASSDPLA